MKLKLVSRTLERGFAPGAFHLQLELDTGIVLKKSNVFKPNFESKLARFSQSYKVNE